MVESMEDAWLPTSVTDPLHLGVSRQKGASKGLRFSPDQRRCRKSGWLKSDNEIVAF
jgi:hypothetical protein